MASEVDASRCRSGPVSTARTPRAPKLHRSSTPTARSPCGARSILWRIPRFQSPRNRSPSQADTPHDAQKARPVGAMTVGDVQMGSMRPGMPAVPVTSGHPDVPPAARAHVGAARGRLEAQAEDVPVPEAVDEGPRERVVGRNAAVPEDAEDLPCEARKVLGGRAIRRVARRDEEGPIRSEAEE